MPTIGLLLGSARTNGNAAGLTAWLLSIFNQRHGNNILDPDDPNFFKIAVIDPHTPPHPLGPVTDPIMAALIKDPSLYASPSTKQWSAFVTSCAGIIILTPQFNWGYPGELKNALDHLYWEWRDKPVMLATYGGHGGNKCAAQLKSVLEGGLKMKYVCDVNITLPKEYIAGPQRLLARDFEASPGSADVNLTTSSDVEFLKQYTDSISLSLDMLLDTVKNQQTS
ncbi:hypothetical protein PILCRDRAFT_821920 [Piloderma croceum F 1598]|uniref:NADPH-dependent FMN reductase-like domain-containing protein n=1 Tax=Piloderma croceum (strain F 1598) TaxID=765440 RepID=A0A0C3FMS1_PILCF|nr:hypothetical protein PILCRDRAFT_821920 [Piloderma croceum F 1598]